jgi:hypothetical protein
MSRNENVQRARDRARQARARLTPVTARVKPLAAKTGVAAKRQVRRTRSWMAPRVKRTGQVLQDDVAPKVSAMMSSAAERIDPDHPREGHGRKRFGAERVKTAATRLRGWRRPAPAEHDGAADVASDHVQKPAEAPDGQASTSSGADATEDARLSAS